MIEIKNLEKKIYIPPVFDVEFVQMESGISAESAPLKVSTVESDISTSWDGEDNIIID